MHPKNNHLVILPSQLYEDDDAFPPTTDERMLKVEHVVNVDDEELALLLAAPMEPEDKFEQVRYPSSGNTSVLKLFFPFTLPLIVIAVLISFGCADHHQRYSGDLHDQHALGQQRRLSEVVDLQQHEKAESKGRILYVVTTLNEYNSGTRSTERGSDRLQLTLIPVVSEGIRSMVEAGYDVDLFLVCHFTLLPEREALVRAALPPTVGLQVWNDATPLGYDTAKDPFKTLEYRTLHLARQHRFVIKDKLLNYDLFVNFEDDMLITAEHINHFVRVTNEIQRLYDEAPEDQPEYIQSHDDAVLHYHGVMTKGQLRRTIPGFIRVEVLLDEENYPAQSDTGLVPVDLDFDGNQKHINASYCCHVSAKTSTENIPESPTADKIMLWETNILPLGVRKMPEGSFLDWVMTQRGSSQSKLNLTDVIGDYWSNRNHDYWKTRVRPKPLEYKYINNQGGWMATRDQLWRWHTEICPGGFLPPYEAPHYRFDGLDMRNVEWYSGGMQLSTVRHACNMQRIIMLDPEHFSKSLIYHTANNKQRQLSNKREETFTKANTLLGQLNTIKKRAAADIKTPPQEAAVATKTD